MLMANPEAADGALEHGNEHSVEGVSISLERFRVLTSDVEPAEQGAAPTVFIQ